MRNLSEDIMNKYLTGQCSEEPVGCVFGNLSHVVTFCAAFEIEGRCEKALLAFVHFEFVYVNHGDPFPRGYLSFDCFSMPSNVSSSIS